MDYFTQQDMHVFEYKHWVRRVRTRERWMTDIQNTRDFFRHDVSVRGRILGNELAVEALVMVEGCLEMLALEHINGALNAGIFNHDVMSADRLYVRRRG